MNVRRLTTAVTKRFTFSCLASLALGCSGTSEQFFIVRNQIPIAGCGLPDPHYGDPRGAGVYDVGIIQANWGTRYQLFPVLQNDLPAQSQPGGTDPNRLLLQEFHVQLVPGKDAPQALVDFLAAPALAPDLSYSEPWYGSWSGFVEPGGGQLPAGGVAVVPENLAQQLNASGLFDTYARLPLVAKVRAVGSTLSETIQSREFDYPISVCRYCLVASHPPCPHAPKATGNPCNVAQDDPVDCCSEGTNLVCPSWGP